MKKLLNYLRNLFTREIAAANGADPSTSSGQPEAAAANAEQLPACLPMDEAAPEVAAANGQDGWMRILPYGVYKHASVGDQVFDRAAVNRISSHLKGTWAKVKQVLSYFTGTDASLPVYNGHPDDAQFAANGHNDWNQYARVPEIEARDDGMWARVIYNDLGRQLLASGKKLYFSPRFLGTPAANGKYYPNKISSFGLFPNPNIREAAAANAETTTTTTMNPLLKVLLGLLGVNDEQTAAANANAEGAENSEAVTKVKGILAEAAKVPQLQTDIAAANGKVTTLTTERDTANGKVTSLTSERDAANAALEAGAEAIITAKVKDGAIPEANRAAWKGQFKANFVSAANGILGVKANQALNTETQTGGAGAQRETAASNAKAEFGKRVEEIMTEKKLSRNKAHAHARLHDGKGKTLYEVAYGAKG
jgi:phage I-like protein